MAKAPTTPQALNEAAQAAADAAALVDLQAQALKAAKEASVSVSEVPVGLSFPGAEGAREIVAIPGGFRVQF